MSYRELHGKVAKWRRTLKDLFLGTEGAAIEVPQQMCFDTSPLAGMKELPREEDVIIERLDGETILTNSKTWEKIFVYDDGDIFSETGRRVGRIITVDGVRVIRDIRGTVHALDWDTLRSLRYAGVA